MVSAIDSRAACLERSEVDDAVNCRVRIKNFVKTRLIGKVHLVERRSFAANKLDTVESDL